MSEPGDRAVATMIEAILTPRERTAVIAEIKAITKRLGASAAHCANCDNPHCELTGKAMLEIEEALSRR